MTSRKNIRLILTIFVLLAIPLACNFPGTASEPPLDDQAATIVAMTLNANAVPQNTPTRATQSTATPSLATATPTVTGTATPTITPTYSTPLLKVNENTNCRTGPGQSFDILITLLPGATVEIVGRYPTDNYWVVKVQGMDQPCWLWGEYSTPSGSFWAVPSVTPPPTATLSPPAAPTNLQYTFYCTLAGEVTTTLSWSDRANDELGYHVYRNSEQIAELPPNSQEYSETISIDIGDTLKYSVAAYNAQGNSAQTSISFSCQ